VQQLIPIDRVRWKLGLLELHQAHYGSEDLLLCYDHVILHVHRFPTMSDTITSVPNYKTFWLAKIA
jgi:hypothetical protein